MQNAWDFSVLYQENKKKMLNKKSCVMIRAEQPYNL